MKDIEIGLLPELIGLLRVTTSLLLALSIGWGYWQGALSAAPRTINVVVSVVILMAFSVWIFLTSFPAFPQNVAVNQKLVKNERIKGAFLILLSTTYLDLVLSWLSDARYAQKHYLLFSGIVFASFLLWPYQKPVWQKIFAASQSTKKNS